MRPRGQRRSQGASLLVRVSGAYMTFRLGNWASTRTSRRVEAQLAVFERHIAMRRTAAVILGTAALLGALTTPAIADTGDSTVVNAVAAADDTIQNLVEGAKTTVEALTRSV